MFKFIEQFKEFCSDFKRYKLQALGALLLIVSFILTCCNLTWFALGSLFLVGVIDIYLVIKDLDTISQRIHKLFPRQIDFIVVIGLLVFTWFIFGPSGFLPIMLGVIIGHLFWNE